VKTRSLPPLASSDLTDDEFVTAFDDCSLPPAKFHHGDHIRLAFILLQRNSLIDALRLFSEGLKRFAIAKKALGLYNETITWSYMLIINDRMVRSEAMTFEEFRVAHSDVFMWQPSILDSMYKRETLISQLAKKEYLLPDLNRPS
jgi:hypothetical protein